MLVRASHRHQTREREMMSLWLFASVTWIIVQRPLHLLWRFAFVLPCFALVFSYTTLLQNVPHQKPSLLSWTRDVSTTEQPILETSLWCHEQIRVPCPKKNNQRSGLFTLVRASHHTIRHKVWVDVRHSLLLLWWSALWLVPLMVLWRVL